MRKHQLLETLLALKGNPRACVYTEPLWGIPYNLYAPFVSVYMLALGVQDQQIGLIASIGMACQIVYALLSGALTDKFGRKRTTLIADLISWSVPMLIYAAAQNFEYFLAAAIVNSAWRISSTSWSCLLVEDAEHDHLVHIWSWIHIAGLLVAFFSPLATVLVNRFSLVPTLRGLYLFAFVMMTTKFLIMNRFVTETRQGQVRLDETRDSSLFSLLAGYGWVLGDILRTPRTLITLGIMLVMSITMTINGSFWGILVTQKLLFPTGSIAIYQAVRSATMLVFFFTVIPWIGARPFKRPMLAGYLCFILSQVLLIAMPPANILLLGLSVVLEACALALVSPLMESMLVVTVNAAERARILSIMTVAVLTLASPFGWIAGQLSSINRLLPFVLNIGLYLIGAVLVWLAAWMVEWVRRAPPQAGGAPGL